MEIYEVTLKFSVPNLDHDGRLDEVDDHIHDAMKEVVTLGLAAEVTAHLKDDDEDPFLCAPHGAFPGTRAAGEELRAAEARTIKAWLVDR